MHWHKNNKYCTTCGKPTHDDNLGHSRKCSQPTCENRIFPRLDPAVIMLITYKDTCLLGRQKVWPKGMHSTLAGFVEHGETLEQAVARETFEESGVKIKNIELVTIALYEIGGANKAKDTEDIAVKADEIDDELELMMQREEYLEPKSGNDIKVENEDWVLIDYSGTIEGKEFTGSIAKELQFKIGGSEYKEIHAALIGMDSGEEIEAVIVLSEHIDEYEGK